MVVYGNSGRLGIWSLWGNYTIFNILWFFMLFFFQLIQFLFLFSNIWSYLSNIYWSLTSIYGVSELIITSSFPIFFEYLCCFPLNCFSYFNCSSYQEIMAWSVLFYLNCFSSCCCLSMLSNEYFKMFCCL